jgi:hypothetical protein
VVIPLDPTAPLPASSSAQKHPAVILLNVAHPTGPF